MESIQRILENRMAEIERQHDINETAYDEGLCTYSQYFATRNRLATSKDEVIGIIYECKRNGIIHDEAVMGTLIGKKGRHRMYMTDNHMIVVMTDDTRTFELDNPKISQIWELKRMLGMES